MWKEYSQHKQTYKQLADKYGCSIKTIQRKLDKYAPNPVIHSNKNKEVIVLLDTTYWGRNFGVMLFRDAISKKNLLHYYVNTETIALYKKGIEELKSQGYIIKAIVCDGRRGLFNAFDGIPVQMCQFHQLSIIRRYLTTKPKLEASKELKEIASLVTKTDKESFEGLLKEWYESYKEFINQRTINPDTNRTYYTHKRVRSAYRSLITNLDWLFTWYDNLELDIPKTTNGIDGYFADLKAKLRNHNGLSRQRKTKFIEDYLNR